MVTKRERAQVVELLRCAADRLLTGASMIAPFTDACGEIYGDGDDARRVLATVRDVMRDVAPDWWDELDNVETAEAALEAATRVELGEWP